MTIINFDVDVSGDCFGWCWWWGAVCLHMNHDESRMNVPSEKWWSWKANYLQKNMLAIYNTAIEQCQARKTRQSHEQVAWNAAIFHMRVSINGGTPKSSTLIGFSLINHPFWGTPIYGNPHMAYPPKPLGQQHMTIVPLSHRWPADILPPLL